MKWESEVIVTPKTVALFIGKKGTGKSTRRKAAMAKAMEAGQRVLAFDVLDEDSQLGRKRDSVVLGPLTHRMTTDELAENLDVLHRERLALAVVPTSREPREWAEDFKALLDDVQDALEDEDEPRGLVLSASELAIWAQYCANEVNTTACLSRHWGLAGAGLLFDSQRATGIPFTTRTQASDILSGLQDQPEDLDALADRCGKRFGDEVAACRDYDFRHWRDTDGRWERTASTTKPGKARKDTST